LTPAASFTLLVRLFFRDRRLSFSGRLASTPRVFPASRIRDYHASSCQVGFGIRTPLGSRLSPIKGSFRIEDPGGFPPPLLFFKVALGEDFFRVMVLMNQLAIFSSLFVPRPEVVFPL